MSALTLERKPRTAAPAPELRWPAGTRVVVNNPDGGRACFRHGQTGTVLECLEYRVTEDERRKRKASVAWLHVVGFDTDVVIQKDGRALNLGKVPVYVLGHEIGAARG